MASGPHTHLIKNLRDQNQALVARIDALERENAGLREAVFTEAAEIAAKYAKRRYDPLDAHGGAIVATAETIEDDLRRAASATHAGSEPDDR